MEFILKTIGGKQSAKKNDDTLKLILAIVGAVVALATIAIVVASILRKHRKASIQVLDEVDLDDDGTVDAYLVDTTGDGKADTTYIDTDGNGAIDTIISDNDGDGDPDTIFEA